jgi:hypothetical protein
MTLKAQEERAAILKAVQDQDEHISRRLDNVLANQEALREGLEVAVRIMREAADREKVYQDKVISMIDREAERQAEREREGLPERRSLWRRFFNP